MSQPLRSASSQPLKHLAVIGNSAPRRCGIATFTDDSVQAMRSAYPDLRVDVYAMDDGTGIDYPSGIHSIGERDPAAYRAAARTIEGSGAQALWLQHEYGIFGGSAGDHILALLDRVTLPVLVTLHTVLETPDAEQRRVLDALIRRASKLIVMAERGRELLKRVYGVAESRVEVIPHGVPDRAWMEPDAVKPRFGFAGRQVLLTFGLLSPGKGIETMIAAMPDVATQHPDALYVVLGRTHPNLVRDEGEAYRDRLKRQARDLGVEENVRFIDGFVETEQLLDYIQAADIYVTPYLNPAQITSGTLAYAVALGKPVISTPYLHASEILGEDHGKLVPFRDSAAMAEAAAALLDDDDARNALAGRAYARGRTMIWSRTAERVMTLLGATKSRAPARLPARAAAHAASPRPLAPDLAAVIRMSDATGMLQHSVYSVPDRNHGYCVDDNARALILMSRIDGLDEAVRDKWTTIYAAFVNHAWNPETGRFRNFMRFDRGWCEDVGSEDSQGRTLWSLGVTARDARALKHRDWASNMFDRAASSTLAFGSPRAQAFAILGAAAMLAAHPGHGAARGILERFGDTLMRLVDGQRRPDWPWFEAVLAYDNARLPEALLRAGEALGRADWIERGLATLDWIVGQQTSPEGKFRAVGTESFGVPYAPPLPFDQQPLEAQATIDACEAALAASGDRRWIEEAQRAYRWFLGQNDLDLPLASPDDGGCFDGLSPTGLNRNQGAESILALQLASATIAELGTSFVAGLGAGAKDVAGMADAA